MTKINRDFGFQGLINLPGFDPVIVSDIMFIPGISGFPFYEAPGLVTGRKYRPNPIIGIVAGRDDKYFVRQYFLSHG